MSDAATHVAAWEAAGLIDGATADRLRAAAVGEPATEPATAPAPQVAPQVRHRSAAAELFGPSVTIPEVFGYLGTAFVLGAWSLVVGRASADGGLGSVILSFVSAAALAGAGLFLRRRGERGSRAAGVSFFVATVYAAAGTLILATQGNLDSVVTGVIAAAAALVVAAVLRRTHPAVLTQAALLTWITVLAQAIVLLVEASQTAVENVIARPEPNPVLLVVAAAAFWLVVAVAIAFLGLAEARAGARTGSRAAFRRSALSRFWAGMTAIVGVASVVTRSGDLPDGSYGRVLEPIVGEAALVVISVVLIERAFRRGATSFMYAAALGLILALSDFNVSYLSGSTELALLVEGLILLGVGFVAYRLRDRIGDDGPIEAATAAA